MSRAAAKIIAPPPTGAGAARPPWAGVRAGRYATCCANFDGQSTAVVTVFVNLKPGSSSLAAADSPGGPSFGRHAADLLPCAGDLGSPRAGLRTTGCWLSRTFRPRRRVWLMRLTAPNHHHRADFKFGAAAPMLIWNRHI